MPKPTKPKVKQAEKQFLNIAKQAAIDLTNPDVAEVWNAFKKFGSIPFDCEQSALLFECGTFTFRDLEMFDVCFVRQFTIHKHGEYDHMEQYLIRMRFTPTQERRKLKLILWSSKFGNLEDFFESVEGLEEFKFILNRSRPEKFFTYQDRI
jgi:hypothetical protein